LVDFERKKWDDSRQAHREPEEDAIAIVAAGDEADTEGGDGDSVRKELSELRGSGKSSADELKAKRLEAAKKRMKLQQLQKDKDR
jgi:hypothetical protein